MARLALAIFCALLSAQVHAFFDGFDVFKQLNQGFEAMHRDRDHHLEEELRNVFAEPVFHGELAGAEDVELVEPEGEQFPGFSHHQGFPGGFFNMFSHGVRGAGRGPWWKGQNVCVEREEVDVSRNATRQDDDDDDDEGGVSGMFGSFEFSSCQQTETKYTCTTRVSNRGVNKKIVVKYQCCHGYARRQGKDGCSEVNLKPLLETIEDLGAKDFARLVKTAELEEKLKKENLTVFAPSDDALRDFMDKMQQENQVEFFIPPASSRRRRDARAPSMQNVVLGHMTAGLVDINDIVNEQILYSEHDNSTLRMNVYPALGPARVTCNCARVTSVNNMAANGVVHVVDHVLPPVTKTLVELLEQDEQLATLTTLLGKAGMLQKLKEPGHMTLFAPTEEAFRKLSPATMKRLEEEEACLERVLAHHQLSHVLCSAAITGHVTTYNLAGDALQLERRYDDDKLFLDDVQIVIHDVMATNGVIHVIDDVIVPDSAKLMSEVLLANNHTMFVSLLNASDSLLSELDAMKNITVFAPSNAALNADAATLDELRADPARLKEVLLYHVGTAEKQSCDLSDDLMVETAAGKQLRVNLYASQPMFLGVRHRATAQCARIIGVDQSACGGVIHTVDRLIVPPVQTVMELLRADPQFSRLVAVIERAQLEALLEATSPKTLLAPTNDAFERIGAENLEHVLGDKRAAQRVVRQHILTEVLCCSGVSGNAWPFTSRVETLSGDAVSVRRDSDNEIHIGTTTVRHCDKMATDGIVHTVNRVMGRWRSPTSRERYTPNLDVVLYGLKDLGL